MSDNFHFDLTGVDHNLAMQVAFSHNRAATHWFETPALPRPINGANKAHSFIWDKYKEAYPKASHESWPQNVPPRFVLCWTKPSDKTVQPAGISRGWSMGWTSVERNRPDLIGRAIDIEVNAFPGKGIGHEAVWPFIEAWLKEADYGSQPDTDGHNSKGWRIFNEGWGHVCGMWQAFVAIEPEWLTYGK